MHFLLKDSISVHAAIEAMWRSMEQPGKWEVVIRPYQEERGTKANNFYWGVIIEQFRDHFGLKPDEAHTLFLCNYFGYEEKHVGNMIIQKPMRTTTTNENGERDVLNSERFAAYEEACMAFAAEQGCCIETKIL